MPLAPVFGLLREGSLEFEANLEQSEFQNRQGYTEFSHKKHCPSQASPFSGWVGKLLDFLACKSLTCSFLGVPRAVPVLVSCFQGHVWEGLPLFSPFGVSADSCLCRSGINWLSRVESDPLFLSLGPCPLIPTSLSKQARPGSVGYSKLLHNNEARFLPCWAWKSGGKGVLPCWTKLRWVLEQRSAPSRQLNLR